MTRNNPQFLKEERENLDIIHHSGETFTHAHQ
jgi:hypothetical protein